MAIENPDSANQLTPGMGGDVPSFHEPTLHPGVDRQYVPPLGQLEQSPFLPFASLGDTPDKRIPPADDATLISQQSSGQAPEAVEVSRIDSSPHTHQESAEESSVVAARKRRLSAIVEESTAALDEYRARRVTRRAAGQALASRGERLGKPTDDNADEWEEVTNELFALRREAIEDGDIQGSVLPAARARIWAAASGEGIVHEDVVGNKDYLRAALELSPPFSADNDAYESTAERRARVDAVMEVSQRIVPTEPAVVRYSGSVVTYSAAAANEHPGGFTFALNPGDSVESTFLVGVGSDPSIYMNNVATVRPDDFVNEAGHVDAVADVRLSVGVGAEQSAALLAADCNTFTLDVQALSKEIEAVSRAEGPHADQFRGRFERQRTATCMSLVDALTAASQAGVTVDLGKGRAATRAVLEDHFAEIGAGPLVEQPAERMEKVGRAIRQLTPDISSEAYKYYMVDMVRARIAAGEDTRLVLAARSIARVTESDYNTVYALLKAERQG